MHYYCLWHSSKYQPITTLFVQNSFSRLPCSFMKPCKYDKILTDNLHSKQNNNNDKIWEQKEWRPRIQIMMRLPRILSKSENWSVKVKHGIKWIHKP